MTDLLQYNEKRFSCRIQETYCEGIIVVSPNNKVYLCQNKKSGATCTDRKGYKYSWCVHTGTFEELRREAVTAFRILDDEAFDKWLTPEFLNEVLLKHNACEISFSEMLSMFNKHIDKQVHIKYN